MLTDDSMSHQPVSTLHVTPADASVAHSSRAAWMVLSRQLAAEHAHLEASHGLLLRLVANLGASQHDVELADAIAEHGLHQDRLRHAREEIDAAVRRELGAPRELPWMHLPWPPAERRELERWTSCIRVAAARLQAAAAAIGDGLGTIHARWTGVNATERLASAGESYAGRYSPRGRRR